jgi:RHS repeat-associated protein
VGDSWWDQDSDLDGLTNAQEVAFGSDPIQRDSDYDGLTDADERDLTPAILGGLTTTDPWDWDSNDDGISDHDAYWSWQSGLSPNVNYSNLTPPSPLPVDYYRDLDGDGTLNLWDYAPTDSTVTSPPADPGSGTGTPPDPSTTDSDWDGHMDASDSHPNTSWLWEDWNYNGTNDSQEPPPPSDSDGDTHYDTSDSHPYNPSLWEDWNGNGTNDSQDIPPTYPPDPTSPPDPNYTNSDGDSAMDANDSDPTNPSLWEDWNRNGTNDSFEPPDADGDGVTDADEYTAGTNPNFHDSDGDGLSDSEERTAQTNPLLVDTDADGLTDHEEIFIYQKNPLLSRSLPGQQQIDYYQVNLADTDLDGIPDLVEAWYGRDPASDADAGSDLDADGHTDLDAYLVGWSFTVSFTVSFTSYDQDRDGITDARESYWGFNPYDPYDATQDADHDGLLNMEEIRLGLDPLSATTHGTPDLTYANTTWNLGWKACLNPGSSATTLDDDTDGDGMPDHWEHRHRLDLRDARDAIRDPDRDTLSNLTEYRFLSHPRIPKSESNTLDRTRLYATGKPLNAATTGGLMNRYRAQMATDLVGSNVLRNFSLFDVKAPQPTNGPGGGGGGGNNDQTHCDCDLPDCTWCDENGERNCQRCGGDTWIPCDGIHITPCADPSTCTKHGYKRCSSTHSTTCDGSKHGTTTDRVFDCHDHQAACSAPACGKAEHIHDGGCDPEETGEWHCGEEEHSHVAACGEKLICDFKDHEHDDDETSSCYKDGPERPKDHDEEGCNNVMHVSCTDDKCVPNPCPGSLEEDCPLPPEDRDMCDEGTACTNCCNGKVSCGSCGGDHKSDTNNCGVPDCACEGVIVSQCPHGTLPLDPPPDPPQIHFEPPSVSASDGAGSRYRKIGLNGLPLADSKPQSQDESGENPEETYVDAYTGLLRHSVSDVYAKADGSELPLMVRRDVSGDVSSIQYGLSASEKPFLPFGPGWSSNVCAYIKFENSTVGKPAGTSSLSLGNGMTLSNAGGTVLTVNASPDNKSRASVVDEQGGSRGFVVLAGVWQPDGSAQDDAKTKNDRLVPLPGGGHMLAKKFGTTCFYEEAGIMQTFSTDRVNGSADKSINTYQRLIEVRDRFGNRLVYQYPGTGTLIPSRIYDPDRPGLQIQIQQNGRGRVTSVRLPDGETVSYNYPPEQASNEGYLMSVERGSSLVQYTYEVINETYIEPQISPTPEPDPYKSPPSYTPRIHTNLASIHDELGNVYSFEYGFDHSTISTVATESQEVVGEYTTVTTTHQGLPRIIQKVTNPRGDFMTYSRPKSVLTSTTHNSQNGSGGHGATFANVTAVVGAVDGSRTSYDFTVPNVKCYSQEVNEFSYVGTFTSMKVTRKPPLGSTLPETFESYTLNPAASMALASVTDLSGNTTAFTYGTDGYDDPLTETSYLQTNSSPVSVTKHFTYDADTRIMTSMTDPMGVHTEYTIDNSRIITRGGMTIPVLGLKTAEKVLDASNTILRETRYSYNHPVFAGLVTKQWTISPEEQVMPSSVTTTTLGDPGSAGFSGGWHENSSRAWILTNQNTTTPTYRCGWWREVTITSGPATPAGELASDSSPSALSSSLTISDLGGKKRQVIDARGFATSFDYDESGRLTRVDHPDGSFKALDYDDHGNLTSETNENGVTTFHRYDSSNRRIKTALDLNGNGLPDWDTSTTSDYGTGDHSYTLTGSTPGTATSLPSYDGDLVTTTFYNNRNQVISQKDARGLLTTHSYDDLGRLESTITGGKTTLFTYDGYNNGGSIFDTSAIKPNRTVDPRGVVTTVVYDSLYRPISSTVSDPGLNGGPAFTAVTLTEYDLAGRPLQVTDPLGRVTLNEYDDLGNLIKVTEPDLTTDTSDNPTVLSYYTHHGKPWKVIDQMGNETTTRYDALGRPVEVKGPPLTVSSSPSLQVSAVTTTEYDAAGNVIAVTDPLGRVVETVYDERNRPTHVYAPTMWDAVSGQFVRPYAVTTYDALGQPTSVTDHTGATTTSHYDRAGRKWKVEAPSLPVSSSPSLSIRPTTLTSFDPGGLPVTVTNPLGQTISNLYDIHGRLIQTLDAEGIYNGFAYDNAGNRTIVYDGLGQITVFYYDGLNRLLQQTFGGSDTWLYQYNAVQKLGQLSPRGIYTSYAYDARDRLLEVNAWESNPYVLPDPAAPMPDGGILLSRTYNYDNAGKLLTVTEYQPETVGSDLSTRIPDLARSVSYTYDAMGRVTAESSQGQVHEYAYDLAGNRVKASYSTGRVVETSYDGLNRPEAIVDGDRLTRYGYDKAGRAVILVAANGQTSQNTYDALGRLTDRTLFKTPAMSEANVLAEFSWSHDLLGNVTKQEETWPGETTRAGELRRTTMGYDDNNRLTTETIATITSSGEDTVTTDYTYDAANNRKTKTVTGGTEPGHWDYTYNHVNQLHIWEYLGPQEGDWKSVAYQYDAAGNRIKQFVTTFDNATYSYRQRTTSYTWDAQDRLSSVTLPDTIEAGVFTPGRRFSYDYDYRTRRVGTKEQTLDSSEQERTAIVFSGGLSVAEYERTTMDWDPTIIASEASSLAVEYTRGPDMGGGVGGLLYTSRSESASASVSSSRTLRYNLSNGRGDIVAQSDAYAALTWTASYEAYGKRTKETGENKDKQRGNSKDEDPTGLLNEGFRYRDIETGVWLSRDPAGFVDGPNLYAYVMQNPWTGFDPKGLATVVDGKRPINQPTTSSGKKTSSRGSTIRDEDRLPDPRLDEKKDVPQEHPFFDAVEESIESSARDETTKDIPEIRFADAEVARAVQQIAEKDYQDRLEADPLFAVQETMKDAAWMALDIALTVETGGSAKTLTSFAAKMKALNKSPVIIGEDMMRVNAYAGRVGGETIDGWLAGRKWTQSLNDEFIATMKADGRQFLDIGPAFGRRLQNRIDPSLGRPASSAYGSERKQLLDYGDYQQLYQRSGKFQGGVSGFDP